MRNTPSEALCKVIYGLPCCLNVDRTRYVTLRVPCLGRAPVISPGFGVATAPEDQAVIVVSAGESVEPEGELGPHTKLDSLVCEGKDQDWHK